MTKTSGIGTGWNLGLFAAVALSACLGRAPASETESEVDFCSGVYACEWPDGVYEVDVWREGTTCFMDDVVLVEGGSIDDTFDPEFPGESWTRDNDSLEICTAGGSCITCTRMGDPPDSGSGQGGECGGSPDSCSSQSPGSCSDVRGCYLHTVYGSDYQVSRYECQGSADSCGGFYSEESCQQQGCEWE